MSLIQFKYNPIIKLNADKEEGVSVIFSATVSCTLSRNYQCFQCFDYYQSIKQVFSYGFENGDKLILKIFYYTSDIYFHLKTEQRPQ